MKEGPVKLHVRRCWLMLRVFLMLASVVAVLNCLCDVFFIFIFLLLLLSFLLASSYRHQWRLHLYAFFFIFSFFLWDPSILISAVSGEFPEVYFFSPNITMFTEITSQLSQYQIFEKTGYRLFQDFSLSDCQAQDLGNLSPSLYIWSVFRSAYIVLCSFQTLFFCRHDCL